MVLFSTKCPQCKVLEMKLQQKGLNFEICYDIQELLDAGIKRAPILKLDSGEYLDFAKAVQYIKEVEVK